MTRRFTLKLELSADTHDALTNTLEDVLLAIERGVRGPVVERSTEFDAWWDVKEIEPPSGGVP